jgi:hypothetical protein
LGKKRKTKGSVLVAVRIKAFSPNLPTIRISGGGRLKETKGSGGPLLPQERKKTRKIVNTL